MAINNPYIPGDPFSYDLKWIVMKIKWLVQQGASLETALEALRSYVDQRFDDPDIQDEVNQKLEEMYEDGSLALLIARYLNVNTPQLHGAVGDGETDDTAAIQAAIDTGIPVFIPDGKYLITDTLKVTNSNVKITGSINSEIVIGDELKTDNNDARWALYIYSDKTPVRKLIAGSITENALSMTLTNADNVKEGMIAKISGDFETSPWTSDNRGYLTKGETNIVKSVNANVVTLTIPVSMPFASSEIVTATFVEPIKNVKLEGLHFTGKNEDADGRQYRGIAVEDAVNCTISDCIIKNCGIASIELDYSVFGIIKSCIVEKSWTYEAGTSVVVGLGYALRDVAGNSNRIENNTVNEARHGVDISGRYPAVNSFIRENTLKEGVDAPVMSTHGTAYKCAIEDNLIYGKTNISGEEITFRENVCYGSVLFTMGRNPIIENNIVPSFSIGVPDTNVRGNFLIIRRNLIKDNKVCFIVAKGDVPYETVYGFVCEDNLLLITGTTNMGVICNKQYSGAETITFTGGLITNNNNSLNRQSYSVTTLALTDSMQNTVIGANEWDSVISNGLYIGVYEPSTNTIGARAYRTRLKVPVWYDGTNWLKADATTP